MTDIFKRKFIGLDISDRNIEAVEIDKEGRVVQIEKISRIRLDQGILKNGHIKDEKKLKLAINKLFKDAKPTPIYAYELYFALPENQSRIHSFFIKKDSKEKLKKVELERYINIEIEENINFDKTELIFSFKIIKEDEFGASVILVASDRGIVSQWHNFFESMNLDVENFDIEALAVIRGLSLPEKIKKNDNSVFCLIDFGSSTTSVTFFKKDVPIYSFPINIAGNLLDKKIAEDLKISKKEAEMQKIKLGLLDENSQIFQSIDKVLKILKLKLKESINSFEHDYGKKVKHLIFIGKSSMLKGFLSYMKADFSLDISFGRPKFLKNYIPIEYVEAVGLTLRAIEKKWEKIHPVLSLELEYFKKKEFLENKKSEERKNYIQTLSIFIIFILSVGIIGSYYLEKNAKEEKELKHKEELKKEGLKKSKKIYFNQEEKTSENEIKNTNKTAYVKVINTPTGWLNVRSGPGTNFKKITRVDVGEEFLLLENGKNWYKIKIDDKTDGWIFSEYALKIEK